VTRISRPGDRIADLVVVPDELQRVGACLAVDLDAHHEAVHLHAILGGPRHHHDGRLLEHRVGGHHEIESVGHRRDREHAEPHRDPRDPAVTPGRARADDDEGHREPADDPAPGVELVGELQAAHPLRTRERHDEPDVRGLEDTEGHESDQDAVTHALISSSGW
jgi:hypothetical protein